MEEYEYDYYEFDPTDNPCDCELEYGCKECNPELWED